MTTTFYAPPSSIRGSTLQLPDDEARHAIRVLRKQAGDEIVVVDGEGGWHRVRLDRVGRDRATGTILETRRGVGEPSYRLTVGIGLLKNTNRFETFLEKAVELGVHRIVPLHTARTEKESLKAQRSRNILVAAMKQCGRSWLPPLSDPQPLPEVVTPGRYDHMFIAHGQDPDAPLLPQAVDADGFAGVDMLMLIGPEGGFTDDEVAMVKERGGTEVSLGARRFRTETAGIVAAAGIQLWGESASDASQPGRTHSL